MKTAQISFAFAEKETTIRILRQTTLFCCFLILMCSYAFGASRTIGKSYNPGTSVTVDGCGNYCTVSGLGFVTIDEDDGDGMCNIVGVEVEIHWAKTGRR